MCQIASWDCFLEGDAIAFIDLIHDVRHLCPRFRIDGIKTMSHGSLACATDEIKLWLKGLCHGSPVHFV